MPKPRDLPAWGSVITTASFTSRDPPARQLKFRPALTALGNDQAHVAEVAVTGCGAMCSPTQLRDLKAKICDAWASW
jgi:hypothetical protein